MAKTIEQIQEEVQQIKNETVAKQNTATRVGGALEDMVEKMEADSISVEGKLTNLGLKVGELEDVMGKEDVLHELTQVYEKSWIDYVLPDTIKQGDIITSIGEYSGTIYLIDSQGTLSNAIAKNTLPFTVPFDAIKIRSNTANSTSIISYKTPGSPSVFASRTSVGDLSELDTTDKSNLVNSINEVNRNAKDAFPDAPSDGNEYIRKNKAWEKITPIDIDATLSQSGKAGDAKVIGQKLSILETVIGKDSAPKELIAESEIEKCALSISGKKVLQNQYTNDYKSTLFKLSVGNQYKFTKVNNPPSGFAGIVRIKLSQFIAGGVWDDDLTTSDEEIIYTPTQDEYIAVESRYGTAHYKCYQINTLFEIGTEVKQQGVKIKDITDESINTINLAWVEGHVYKNNGTYDANPNGRHSEMIPIDLMPIEINWNGYGKDPYQTAVALFDKSGKFLSAYKDGNGQMKLTRDDLTQIKTTYPNCGFIVVQDNKGIAGHEIAFGNIKSYSNYNFLDVIGKRLNRVPLKIFRSDSEIEIYNKLYYAFSVGYMDVEFETGEYIFSSIYEYMKNTLSITDLLELPIGGHCRYFLNGSTLISNPADTGSAFYRNVFGTMFKSESFELYDGIIVNRGGKYCVHDDTQEYDIPYTRKYINCIFITLQSEDGKTPTSPLGCGVGKYANVSFDGCVFESCTSQDFFVHGIIHDNRTDPCYYSLSFNNCKFDKQVELLGQYFKNIDHITAKISNSSFGSTGDLRGFDICERLYKYGNVYGATE